MQKTRFERYLDKSIRQFHNLQGKAMTPMEVMKHFFPQKVATKVESFLPDMKRKNAIILVGPSCCGKTTFAREFVKNNPAFTLVSMDQCAAEDMKELDEVLMLLMAVGAINSSPEDFGNRRFGQMLEAGHKNIIIDGNWMHVNSRGALLKVLKDLGYYTCIYLILPDDDSYAEKIRSRCLEIIASRRTGDDALTILDGADLIKSYAESIGFTVEDAIGLIEGSEEYAEFWNYECQMLDAEIEDARFVSQLEGYIVFLGADELYEMTL